MIELQYLCMSCWKDDCGFLIFCRSWLRILKLQTIHFLRKWTLQKYKLRIPLSCGCIFLKTIYDHFSEILLSDGFVRRWIYPFNSRNLTSIQNIYLMEKIERQHLVYLGRQFVNSAMRCLNPEVHFFPVIVNHLV